MGKLNKQLQAVYVGDRTDPRRLEFEGIVSENVK